MASLIPGLTNDVAELCLSRIPRSDFPIISQVCWRWRRFLRHKHYAAVRKLSGSVEEFMCVLLNKRYWDVFDRSGTRLGRIPTVPGPFKCGFGLTVLDERKIVFFGGKYAYRRWNEVRGLKARRLHEVREPAFTNADSADVYEFNPATNRWRKLADMNIPRHDFGYAVVDGLLYVIRGYTVDDVSILNGEVYNPKTNKWSLMDCPHRPNFRPAFTFSFNSKLFVAGNGLRFIDIYDPRKKAWEKLDSGKTLLVHAYTVAKNKVYILNYPKPGMGVFDPEKNSWRWVDMPGIDYRFNLGQWNNKVILFRQGCDYEVLNCDFDKEDADKWRPTPIILSGYHATSVLINF